LVQHFQFGDELGTARGFLLRCWEQTWLSWEELCWERHQMKMQERRLVLN
jgi:hypothetical protein